MNNKGNFILLTVIATLTLLFAVAGATFSYFGAAVTGTKQGKTVEVTNGTLIAEYETNSKIESKTATPGTVIATKTFTIEGIITNANNLKYDIDLDVSQNDYEKGELSYSLVSKNDSNNGFTIKNTKNDVAMPKGKSTISIGTGSFAGPTGGKVNHTYVLTIKYVGEGKEESNKVFKGKISITQD